MISRSPMVAAWAYGAAVAAALGYFLVGIPIQLTETFGSMLHLDASWRDLFVAEFTQQSYLRPMMYAAQKVVYDASGGNYFPWFRGAHVVEVALLIALYLHLVKPRTWRDAAVVPIGLAVLIGIHTFNGTVREAFPINTFLTILVCSFAAAAVVLGGYRWWNDLFTVVLLAFAALTVESGLLIAVVIVGGFIVGGRGVSRLGLALTIAGVAAYIVLRVYVLHIGSPTLTERSAGFGFQVLDTSELVRRFGANPWPFYAYNVLTSVLSVLLSEPRSGVFRLTASFTDKVQTPLLVSAIASLAATAAIGWYVWHRRRDWLAWQFDRDDRLVALFIIVLFANAAISYPYTKDVIMSPAGAFYALAAFVAFRRLLETDLRRPAAAAAIAAWCLVAGATWALRSAGTHMDLRQAAFEVRNEWAYADQWFEDHGGMPEGPRAAALLRTLRTDAIARHPGKPPLAVRWTLLEVGN